MLYNKGCYRNKKRSKNICCLPPTIFLCKDFQCAPCYGNQFAKAMVIAFCNIYFGLVANCDWFFFIYVVCHYSIFLRSQIVTLNVLLLIIVMQRQCFQPISHYCTNPFFEKNEHTKKLPMHPETGGMGRINDIDSNETSRYHPPPTTSMIKSSSVNQE